MKFLHIVAAAACIAAATPSFAAPVTIDFEGTTPFASIGDYYSAQGISFSGPALSFANNEGGSPLSNMPSGETVMFSGGDGAPVMNVASGFTGELSFLYSAAFGVGTTTVNVYDGLNGTGNIVGTKTFAANAGDAWDTWNLFSLALSGVGKSISFGDTTSFIAFDNVTVNAVPLPAAVLLFPFGAAGLAAFARRKRAAA